MFLLLAIGNPGDRYRFTRHNLGVLVLMELIKLYDNTFDKNQHYYNNQYSFIYNNQKIIAQWNVNYVNNTGPVIGLYMTKKNIPPKNFMVLFDNLELEFSQWKYSYGYGTYGHNGLKSIKNILQEQNYHRISLGIDRPDKTTVSDYVLQTFSKNQMDNIYNIAYDLYKNNILDKLINNMI